MYVVQLVEWFRSMQEVLGSLLALYKQGVVVHAFISSARLWSSATQGNDAYVYTHLESELDI